MRTTKAMREWIARDPKHRMKDDFGEDYLHWNYSPNAESVLYTADMAVHERSFSSLAVSGWRLRRCKDVDAVDRIMVAAARKTLADLREIKRVHVDVIGVAIDRATMDLVAQMSRRANEAHHA